VKSVSIVAERALAQHCEALVRKAPGLAELIVRLDAAAGKLARGLAGALAPLAGGKGVTVKPRPAREVSEIEFSLLIPELSASTLFGLGAEALPLVVSLDAGAVLRMVDRTFGGRGAAPAQLPAEFPGSADMMIERLEGLVTAELNAAFAPWGSAALTPLRRSGALDELEAFPGIDQLVLVELQVSEPAGDAWPITLALPAATLAAMSAGSAAERARLPRSAADPLAEPFAGIRLDCTAVLVDMRLSMKTVAALRPGAMLPVAVARQVPLRLADRSGEGPVLATGTVGAAEDRVALQITSAT